MHIDILTLFPAMFNSPLSQSMIKRAQDQNQVTITTHDLRNWATNSYKTVDDHPYGGGPGMVMLIEPIDKALKEINQFTNCPDNQKRTILTSAKGTIFNQQKAIELSRLKHLIFIAGHYEGVDQRVAEHLVDEEVSIGNFVLTGGELPIMVMVDTIVRLLPGVLGDAESLTDESHIVPGYLEYPQYTRPEDYHGWRVPDVLLSGHHTNIEKWRQEKSQLKLVTTNSKPTKVQ
jgi:tRNA (guanine37-N1)-methyltransferase